MLDLNKNEALTIVLVTIVDYIITSRSESFLLSPKIEDRDEVEVGNWAKHKKTHLYSEWYMLLRLAITLIFIEF
jgi:hypothetical protein